MYFDLLIAGSGASGIAAATTAAQLGARVLLLEKKRQLGGLITAGFDLPIAGLFKINPDRPPELLNHGFCEQFFQNIRRVDPDPVFQMGLLYLCRCRTACFRRVCDSLIRHPNIEVVTGVTGLEMDLSGRKILAVHFYTLEGLQRTVSIGAVIDCTGDGSLLRQSGAAFVEPTQQPLAGWFVRIDGVDADPLLAVKVPAWLRRAVEEGRLPYWARFTFYTPDDDDASKGVLKFNPPPGFGSGETVGVVQSSMDWLRAQIPGWQQAKITGESDELHPREGSRLQGQIVLTGEDVENGRHFKDAVARSNWPMEYWDPQQGPLYMYSRNNAPCDIPLRSLRSATFDNLFAAGRCISADSMALSSIRVAGTAMALGEAAARNAISLAGV